MDLTPPVDAGLLTGRQQAFAMIASKCTYAQAVCLKQIHTTRAYEQFGLSWEDFCSKHVGISRVHAERIIHRLDEFGEAWFRLSALARISTDLFREIHDRVTADTIELDGEQIPLIPANTQKIRAGIRRLQDEVRRLSNHYRAPTRTLELGVREDDILKAVETRARLGRALPHDEASGLRSLIRHSITKWTELEEMLRVPNPDNAR
jgi:hypothetical protein